MLSFELLKNRHAWIVQLRNFSHSIDKEADAILEAHFPVSRKRYSVDVDCQRLNASPEEDLTKKR
jgi:hypothetical protein